MDLGRYLSNLQDTFATATRTATTEVQEAAENLARTLEPALRLTLLEFASDLTGDITVQLDGDSVEVRVRGGQPEIVVERRPRASEEEGAPFAPSPPPPPPPPPPGSGEDGAGTARISLRLPESLKGHVEDAAAEAGVSVNTWLVRAAQQALWAPAPAAPTQHTARRMTGWAR